MSAKEPVGAMFEISVDGVPRTHRDLFHHALEGAAQLKRRNPHALIAVRDLRTSEKTIVTKGAD